MLDRQVAPPVQPLASVTLPAADVFSLPNGARLHVMHNDAQPVIRLQLVFPAGKWYDPASGVSLLAARMLLEGTRTRTARQIADQVAFYGASLECEQGFDRATLTLYCLTRHLEKLLPLVFDVVTEPTFPETEFELLKARTIQNVHIERQKPSYLAAERFSQNLYGQQHPYGRAFNEEQFSTISTATVRHFHRLAYRLDAAEIFLCGDVSPTHIQDIQDLLSKESEALTASATKEAVTFEPKSTDYVPVNDSLQASLRLGRIWPSLHHPDTHALQVLVKVAGGYFGSRLMKNIREDKGFTYGIQASVSPREQATSFVIGTEVNAESREAAIREIHFELRKLQEELIPDDELQIVKNYIAGKFANDISTVFEQCDKYKSIVFLSLPSTYYTEFLKQISEVEPLHLQQLAQQYFNIEDLVEVVAGPAE